MRQFVSRLIATPAVQIFIRAVCTHSARVRVLQQTLAGLQPHGISPVGITAEMIRFWKKNRSKCGWWSILRPFPTGINDGCLRF